jgi:hypothetical protein
MNPKTIVKAKPESKDPVGDAMIAFQKKNKNGYNQLYAATASRFAQMNGAMPSSQVNKTGYANYIGGLGNEFRKIVGQFMDDNGAVDEAKVNAMVKKYAIGRISSPADLKKTINGIQRTHDVSKDYYNKSITPAQNKLKFDAAGGVTIMGGGSRGGTTQEQYDLARKEELKAKTDFQSRGGTITRIR